MSAQVLKIHTALLLEDSETFPEFQFSLDGLNTTTAFDGSWDFESFKDSIKGSETKGVDLDEIIRNKGGLEAVEKSDEEVEEESVTRIGLGWVRHG
ncbi:hypothetical protein TRICI_000618 [Trichomonascus ciferrii]|uniref:Uncharacterized protein n=1 Tax=Trichomonascus ciferrii TaxID=44093 RepID=A0A642VCW5_9ASCO|nr:hypothetical protein TRICI_000618 [Trichomonascus ciferrii]